MTVTSPSFTNPPLPSPPSLPPPQQQFTTSWKGHVEKVVAERPSICSAIDVYNDRKLSVFVGGIVVIKMVVRKHSKLYPAVCIESICAPEKNLGNGSKVS